MAEFRIEGRHVLAGVLTFFAVVIVANVIFMTLAIKSFPGQEEQKPYLQGLNYNEMLEERRRQEALGWQATVEQAELRDDGAGVIELSFRDDGDSPLDRLEVTGALERPAFEAERELEFLNVGGGRYRAVVEMLDAGVWSLSARAADGAGQRFDIKARVVIE